MYAFDICKLWRAVRQVLVLIWRVNLPIDHYSVMMNALRRGSAVRQVSSIGDCVLALRWSFWLLAAVCHALTLDADAHDLNADGKPSVGGELTEGRKPATCFWNGNFCNGRLPFCLAGIGDDRLFHGGFDVHSVMQHHLLILRGVAAGAA